MSVLFSLVSFFPLPVSSPFPLTCSFPVCLWAWLAGSCSSRVPDIHQLINCIYIFLISPPCLYHIVLSHIVTLEHAYQVQYIVCLFKCVTFSCLCLTPLSAWFECRYLKHLSALLLAPLPSPAHLCILHLSGNPVESIYHWLASQQAHQPALVFNLISCLSLHLIGVDRGRCFG